ncbi:hypothetical protein AVEN_210323-1 [Araneus ventricosus]|uniref:PiggyBac transposable element-derived protein domain-containing protein n=1 Tax=Araneus ventricosus TaxID=182803 RepID=A0A4Y2LZA9_ARAVE|nr:hypothetical protein AVEN_210323-1 [Araneus ventricosus]
MLISYEKETERLRKLLSEIETDEDSDFDNGPENILEKNFSDHASFSERDTESEEDGYFRNEEGNNWKWFTSNDGVKWRKANFKQDIRTLCHNIVSRVPGTKGPAKDATSPEKSWELFIHDNMILLIVECTNIFIEKSALRFLREREARKTVPVGIRLL